MNMKISSIKIKCRKENVFIQLSNKISFIYGNAGVGKTTLLNLISYGMGNSLVKTLAVEQEVLGVCVNILVNGELISLERKINSNSIILTKNNEVIRTIVDSYHTFIPKERYPYVVLNIEGNKAYLVNGENRSIDRPKEKKLKHLQPVNKVPEILQEKLIQGKQWTNEEIKRALKLAKQD